MIKYVPALILFFLITTCTKSVEKSDKLNIFVSVLPQKYFVERIADNNAEVHVMVLPGHSPATYEPTPSQMKEISEADIYFRIGVPFEEIWMKKLAKLNPELMVIDTREGIALRSMDSFITLQRQMDDRYYDAQKENHDHYNQKDPHIWLSPELVKIQARTICKNLQHIDPENSDFYSENLQMFLDELTSLQNYFDEHLSQLEHKEFLVFHPSWGYLADELAMIQIPIQIEGKSPSPKHLTKIIAYAKDENIRVIFAQKQFSKSAAQTVSQAIQGKVILIDPLAEDYCENMRSIADIFLEVLDEK
jgi:zinc transport system substrate-binding protein